MAQETTGPPEICDTAAVEQFTDVADGEYASAYVLCMRSLGLSVGIGAGTYGPDSQLNRGQMASFLVRLWRDVLGNQCPTGIVTPFTDVPDDSPHANNIECIYGLEITIGTGADTYGPGDPLKATQISRFLYRVYNKAGGDMCPSADGSELHRAAECLLQLRIVPTTGEATATTTVTRAQMAVYMVGLWHNLSGKGLPPPPPPLGTPTPVATTTTTTQPTHTAPTTQRIAYTVNKSTVLDRLRGVARHEIWVINAGGTDQKHLAGDGWGPVWSPDGTRIAYTGTRLEGPSIRPSQVNEVWVMNADGTDQKQLIDKGHGPVWSPDGTRIAYETGFAAHGFWVMNAGGTDQKHLADDHTGRGPVWSPDGTRIAYSARRLIDTGDSIDSIFEVWVMNADGTDQKQLIDKGHSPLWSPDGTRIAYSARRLIDTGDSIDSIPEVWVMNADGTDQKQLIDKGHSPLWSPDGTRIAYSARRLVDTGDSIDSIPEVWVMNADGTDQKQLTDYGWDPVWSPDGTRIAYTEAGVWVVNADGTDQKQLTDDNGQGPAWSPDGTRIAYTGTNGVWVVNADGTDQKQLTDDNGQGPVWSPVVVPEG